MDFKKVLMLVVLFFNIGCIGAQESVQTDYDVFCSIVEDAMAPAVEPRDRLFYIQDHSKSKDVKEAFNLIFQIPSDERYQVFKQSVEDDSGQSWECSVLNEFFIQSSGSIVRQQAFIGFFRVRTMMI